MHRLAELDVLCKCFTVNWRERDLSVLLLSHCIKHYVVNQTRLVCPTAVTLHQTLCRKSDETCLSDCCHTAPNITSYIRRDLSVLLLSHCIKHYVVNQTRLVCPTDVTLHQKLCRKSDEN